MGNRLAVMAREQHTSYDSGLVANSQNRTRRPEMVRGSHFARREEVLSCEKSRWRAFISAVTAARCLHQNAIFGLAEGEPPCGKLNFGRGLERVAVGSA